MRFEEFVGNKPIRDALVSAISSKRIANAYLFAGPRGLGKRTLALLCAQALLCESFDGEPCGRCDSCSRCNALKDGEGFHPDLLLVEPEGKFIKVDRVRRDLIAPTQMRPQEGSWQVFVIDPAEAMHPSAANAFLKTLEEAPGSAVFFLISASPAALLPTVLSRCQRFNFQRLDQEDLARELEKRKGLSPEEALAVAGLSGGAVGTALDFDLERYREERAFVLQMLRLALGDGGIEDVFALAARLHKDEERLKKGEGQPAKEEWRFERRMELLTGLLRDMMLIASAGSGVAAVNEDIKGELVELARGRSPRKLAQLSSLIAEMREPLLRNVRIDSVCERVMLGGRELFGAGRISR